jgi:hypothetical protein
MLAFLVAVAATAGAGPANRDMPGSAGQWCHGAWITGQC